MLIDPLFYSLVGLGLSWWLLWLSYAILFILTVIAILGISGGKKRIIEYLKDPLGFFFWPFFILGPISGSYLYIGQLGERININLAKIGIHYQNYSLSIGQWKSLFWIILLISILTGIEGQIRYARQRSSLWLNRPKILHPLLMILFNVPLGVMGIATIIRLIDQWVVLHLFMNSSWLPTIPYHADEMYGLRWLYNIIIAQTTLALIASFGSIIMLIREGKQKYSWMYKAIFFACILVLGIALTIIISDLNSLLERISETFYTNYIVLIRDDILITNVTSQTELLEQILLTQRLLAISQLPNKIPIPNWLGGLLGIRVLVLFPELYELLAKKLGWKNLPKSFAKVIKDLAL